MYQSFTNVCKKYIKKFSFQARILVNRENYILKILMEITLSQ